MSASLQFQSTGIYTPLQQAAGNASKYFDSEPIEQSSHFTVQSLILVKKTVFIQTLSFYSEAIFQGGRALLLWRF